MRETDPARRGRESHRDGVEPAEREQPEDVESVRQRQPRHDGAGRPERGHHSHGEEVVEQDEPDPHAERCAERPGLLARQRGHQNPAARNAEAEADQRRAAEDARPRNVPTRTVPRVIGSARRTSDASGAGVRRLGLPSSDLASVGVRGQARVRSDL